MRDQLFIALDLLRNLPQGVITSLAEQLTAGLTKIIVDNPKCLKYVWLVFEGAQV